MQRGSSAEFERVIGNGGVVLFPSDTVYGLACDPENSDAIERLYALKRRPADKAAAVMFFDLHAGLRALPEIGTRTHGVLHSLMPGPITALLNNPRGRFPLTCRADPATLGLRIISVPQLEAVRVPVLQSSANLSGGADARRLADIAPELRRAVDLVIDGGELPGVPSTIVDLRRYEDAGEWSIVRLGAVDEPTVAANLDLAWEFDPATYAESVRADIRGYDDFQARVAGAAATMLTAADADRGRARVLELGVGTGETTTRLLAAIPDIELVCLDASSEMLAEARRVLPEAPVEFVHGRLQEPLPAGSFDLVVSSLTIHHLDDREKSELFRRIRTALATGGRFVLADVIVPDDPADAAIPLTPGFDRPSRLSDLLRWLSAAGFGSVEVVHQRDDLAIVVAA